MKTNRFLSDPIAALPATASPNARPPQGRPTLTPAQARRAIAARKAGEWDQPDLVAFGPLGMEAEDVSEIAACAGVQGGAL